MTTFVGRRISTLSLSRTQTTTRPGCAQWFLAKRLTRTANLLMMLVGVAAGDVARDAGAFCQVAADGEIGRRRAGAVSLLETLVAAIEARDHAAPPFSARSLGVNQGLHLDAPFLPLLGLADGTQVVQRAEDFRQPLKIV